jgi:acyl-CoA synthetase (AMP-forming)/AMP-acid ligase II
MSQGGPVNLGAMLQARAAEHPGRDALIFADGRVGGAPRWSRTSYGELDRRSDRYAAGLRAQGLARGDRVLFLARPSPEFYAVLFGVVKLGAIPVLVDPGMGLKNVLRCIEQIAPRAMVARRPFRSVDLRVTVGRRWFWGGPTLERCLGPDAPFEMEPFSPEDEVGIVFTSGSTGTPKGVTYTHRVFHGVATLADARLGRIPGRHYLECFAAYVLFDVAQGMTAVVPDIDLSRPAKADPARIVEALQDHRCEGAFASPVILRKLFRHCRATGAELPHLRDVLTGVAPIGADLHRGLRATSPEATLHVVYGATEGMTVAHTDSDEILGEAWAATGRGAGNCVGRTFPGMEARILAVVDHDLPTWADVVELPDGEIGEIAIRGPVVSPEYKDRPDANAASKIRDGQGFWHRTGDLGRRDESGRLWFCGRKAHRVRTAQGDLPSVPVEGVFNEAPGVARTALVGVGAPGHQLPVLWVELEPGASWSPEAEAAMLARAEGTPWAGRVSRVLLHRGFPVDARHNSKIRREDLAAEAARHPDLASALAPR